MPEEETSQEKTHPATPRRRRKARERGQVAKSTEVNSVLILIVGLFLMRFLGMGMLQKFCEFFSYIWGNASKFSLTPSGISQYFNQGIFQVLGLLSPIILGIAAVGIAADLMQGGFLFTIYPLTPDLDKINPVKGLKRLFSKRALMQLLVSLLKISIVGYIAYVSIKASFNQLPPLVDKSVGQILIFSVNFVFQVGLRCLLGLIPLAILDYSFQKFEYEKGLRMTKREALEEYKQTEGNPLIKTRIRSLQKQIARHRMMQEIPKADVVITNPTKIAVALKYQKEKMNAPIVLAKGARLIAEKIKSLAIKHNIPIVENKWLAQALYKSVEIGQEIPIKFYQAVAEVLAYVYRLKK